VNRREQFKENPGLIAIQLEYTWPILKQLNNRQ
jgi:hypothetical protein